MKKALVVAFRVVILLAFIFSVLYVAKYWMIATDLKAGKNFTSSDINGWVLYYNGYLYLSIAALVFSIICFKTTETVDSIFRTFSLAIIVVLAYLGYNVMHSISNIFNAQSIENYSKALEDSMGVSLVEAVKFIVSWGGAIVLLILVFTSVFAVLDALRTESNNGKEANAFERETKTNEEEANVVEIVTRATEEVANEA